ncbi:carboxypeptidase-like regulatory domain-containing protein [Sunxiuqinia elliptica]
MEKFAEFLIQASIGIILFFLVYWLFLRQSTHFRVNRFYLLFALGMALVLALFPIHYQTTIQAAQPFQLSEFNQRFQETVATENLHEIGASTNNWIQLGWLVYSLGVLIFLLRLIFQLWKPIKIIRSQSAKQTTNFHLHENDYYDLPFSFFNHVFINPKYHKQEEFNDILAHEQVHIQERHWIDLLFIELLTVLLWFNPFIWLFEHAIKQNHEYLADEGVLTRGHSPVRYQALLINQLMGTQVIRLTNNLTFALGPTRLKMMKKQKTSKRKLFRLAWALPVITILLFSFAEPAYQYQSPVSQDFITYTNDQIIASDKVTIQGIVVDENGNPLPGTSIVVKGTSIGTVADHDGTFTLNLEKAKEFTLVASYVVFQTKVNALTISENDKQLNYRFVMEKAVIAISNDFPNEKPTPDPTSTTEVTNHGKEETPKFFIVEDLPHYPNGHYGLGQYVKAKQRELKEQLFFKGEKLKGKATIGFTVNDKGEVTNVQVLEKTTVVAAKTGMTIVSGMENWSPGSQRGKAVPVNFALPFEF